MNDIIKISVPDKHLRLVWKGIKEALVFNDSNTSDISSSSTLLTSVQWISTMQDPILRYLAIQSYHIFENAQTLPDFNLESILTISKEYRAILTECEDQLTTEIKKVDTLQSDEEKYTFLTSHCNIIKDFQMIWHLAEIFFIKLSSPGYFVQDLKNWLNLQQPNVSIDYDDLIDTYNSQVDSNTDMESSEKFWPTVLSLAMHGRKKELLNLLSCHSHSNGQAFRAMRQVIDLMPVFDYNFAKSNTEFEYCWNQWQSTATRSMIDSCLLKPYPALELLANIILGRVHVFNDPTIIKLSDGCWFYSFVVFLQYSQPLADAKQITSSYKSFKRQFLKEIMNDSDFAAQLCSEQYMMAVESVFALDLGQLMRHISSSSNNWWLCAHLVDLIEKLNPHLFPTSVPAHQLTNSLFDETMIARELPSMRESFILEYASGLASHPGLLLTAFHYLHYCPVMGRANLSLIIDRLYFQTDKMASMVHSWCLKYGYDGIAAGICRRRYVAAFKNGQWGMSLVWALRGDDTGFMSQLAHQLLRERIDALDRTIVTSDMATVAKETTAQLMECLRDSGAISMVLGKKMAFLMRFCEAEALLEKGEPGQAAVALIGLLRSELIPSQSRMGAGVLRLARPMLEAARGLWAVDDVYQLLQMLEDASNGVANDPCASSELAEIRKMLVHELARACLVQDDQ